MGIGKWIRKKGEEQAGKWKMESRLNQARKAAYDAEYRRARGSESIKAEIAAARQKAGADARAKAGRHGFLGGGGGLNIGELPSVAGRIQKNSERPIFDFGGGGRSGGVFDPFGTEGGGRKKKGRRQPKEPSFW